MIHCSRDVTRIEAPDRELTTFVETLTTGLGRPERRSAMGQYITGLLLDGERKSIEPIAARLVEHAEEIQAMNIDHAQAVVGDYFETMGIPIVEGRGFEPADAASPGLVAVVNETTVNTAYGGDGDEWVAPANLEPWREHTTATFRQVVFKGGHLFVNEDRGAVLAELAREVACLDPFTGAQ